MKDKPPITITEAREMLLNEVAADATTEERWRLSMAVAAGARIAAMALARGANKAVLRRVNAELDAMEEADEDEAERYDRRVIAERN